MPNYEQDVREIRSDVKELIKSNTKLSGIVHGVPDKIKLAVSEGVSGHVTEYHKTPKYIKRPSIAPTKMTAREIGIAIGAAIATGGSALYALFF